MLKKDLREKAFIVAVLADNKVKSEEIEYLKVLIKKISPYFPTFEMKKTFYLLKKAKEDKDFLENLKNDVVKELKKASTEEKTEMLKEIKKILKIDLDFSKEEKEFLENFKRIIE